MAVRYTLLISNKASKWRFILQRWSPSQRWLIAGSFANRRLECDAKMNRGELREFTISFVRCIFPLLFEEENSRVDYGDKRNTQTQCWSTWKGNSVAVCTEGLESAELYQKDTHLHRRAPQSPRILMPWQATTAPDQTLSTAFISTHCAASMLRDSSSSLWMQRA